MKVSPHAGKPAEASILQNVPDSSRPTIRRCLTLQCRNNGLLSARGNNNAYCQDNETSWVDWTHLEQHNEIFRFTRGIIAFRRAHSILTTEEFYTGAEIQWFGSQGGLPNWADPRCKTLACLVHENGQDRLYLMFNAATRETDFGLPALPQGFRWHLAVDTSRSAPQDLFAAGEEALVDDSATYHVEACSSAILVARKQKSASGGGPV